jgi:hypothetical protein
MCKVKSTRFTRRDHGNNNFHVICIEIKVKALPVVEDLKYPRGRTHYFVRLTL